MKPTPKQLQERRARWLMLRWQHARLWAVSTVGAALTVLLPGLRDGVAGVTLRVPTALECAGALAITFVALLLDEGWGGNRLTRNPQVWRRKMKHALLTGIAAESMVTRLIGGG